jgi:hypothetical protein
MKVSMIIIVFEEDASPVVSSLYNVERESWYADARKS